MNRILLTKFCRLFFHTCILTLALFVNVGCGSKQPTDAFDPEEGHEALEKLAQLLEEDFIYPQIGKSYATILREKVKSKTYLQFAKAYDFAKAVTADLQAVHAEGHLKLQPPQIVSSDDTVAASVVNGVGKVGMIAPGVGYISLHGFSGNSEEYNQLLKKLRSALEQLSTAKTLIIDARPHTGGAMQEMDIMFSYFFDKPTMLVSMDTRLDVEKRGGSPLAEGETLKRVDAPAGIVRRMHYALPSSNATALSTAKIFLLTSKKTASAGEHLALALKRTDRAILVGETTAGAGHFGRTVSLGGGYRAFIPVGRTFDPETGKGWEQTGVEPHIKVSADQALDQTLKRIGLDKSSGRKILDSLKY
jgi:C-terminal processing protease CtpA/Prc